MAVYWAVPYDNGNVSGTATIDWSKSLVQHATMTAATAFTFSNPQGGMRCLLHLYGPFTPTMPTNSRPVGGSWPTWTATGGKEDILTCIYNEKTSLWVIQPGLNTATT